MPELTAQIEELQQLLKIEKGKYEKVYHDNSLEYEKIKKEHKTKK